MSDQVDNDEVEEDESEEGRPERKRRLSGKKIVLFVVLPLLVILGGGAGALFSGIVGGAPGAMMTAGTNNQGAAGGSRDQRPKEVVFYDLPELLVNLNTVGRTTSFLKLQVSLELDSPGAAASVQNVLPRIVDNFQVYLRELRPDEISGSAGMYRLKEELLVRVNVATQPVEVRDILFKEILVQ